VYAAKKPRQVDEPLNLLNGDVAAVKASAAKRAAKAKSGSKPKDAPSHLTADSRGVVLDDDDSGAGGSGANGVVKKRFTLQQPQLAAWARAGGE